MANAVETASADIGNIQVARRHFHTFDALRFLAFFKVFLLHIPVVAFPWFNYIKAGGGIGVQFFFVLSGFLITYIICEEKKRTGNLDLRNFFVRRILRIWPLYYLMVAVAFLTHYILAHLHLPSSPEGYKPQLWVSILFLENYKMMVTHTHANTSPLSVMWSLCIEEHFYIVWGLLLYYCHLTRIPSIISISILLSPVIRLIYVYYNIPTSDLFTNIDLFAYGAIPAYLWINHQQKTEKVLAQIPNYMKFIFIIVLVIVVILCSQLQTDRSYILATCLLGVFFSTLILCILPEKNIITIRNKNWLSLMGIYTYGLYLYHTLVINLLRQVFVRNGWSLDDPIVAFGFFILSFIMSLIISWLSYKVFEKPFLKLKRYFRTRSGM